MGTYLDYCEQQDEATFEIFYRDYIGLIYKIIAKYGLYNQREDVKQEVYIELIRASKIYNSERMKEKSFVSMVTERAIMTYLNINSRKKFKAQNEAISIDDNISIEGYDRLRHEIIADEKITEDEVIVRENIRYYYNIIKNRLTRMELAVWLANIKYNDYHNTELISDATGYRIKQIDNALQRIRGKIAKIRSEEECKQK